MKYTKAILTMLVLSTGTAFAADETEDNQPITKPDTHVFNANTKDWLVDGVIGKVLRQRFDGVVFFNDADYYQLCGNENELFKIGALSDGQSDPVLAIYRDKHDGTYEQVRMVDDSDGKSAVIEDFKMEPGGCYYIAVSPFPYGFNLQTAQPVVNRNLTEGKAATPDGVTLTYDNINSLYGGSYQLSVTKASDGAVKNISIKIKPGSGESAPLNPKSRGKIPVAILGSHDFVVTNIDRDSVRFGPEGATGKCDWVGTDVNGDGDLDLVCHFPLQDAGFVTSDTEATLTGMSNDGVQFKGTDSLRIVPKEMKLK